MAKTFALRPDMRLQISEYAVTPNPSRTLITAGIQQNTKRHALRPHSLFRETMLQNNIN